jgi:glucose/arabinose dehydrogenase
MKTHWIGLIAISLLIIFSGCNQNGNGSETRLLASSEIDSLYPGAAGSYQVLCAGCHGAKVMAFVDREWERGHKIEHLARRIREGDMNDGMPAFADAFSESEIMEMAEYINLHIENLSVYEFDGRPDINQVFQSAEQNFTLELVADDLDSPWGMAFLPGDGMLISDRNGKLYLSKQDGGFVEVEGVPDVLDEGQGGLMDVELHPDFTENKLVYISYSIFRKQDEDIQSTTAIARAKLVENRLEGLEVIFEAFPYSRTRHHYGSRIEFDRDGYLFFSVGDRGNRDRNPQALDNHCGKIHRLFDDGSIPEDNPFVGNRDALPSIYSYGHRNPQGMVLHPETGELWTHEHGPRGGDEINIIRPGANYGWPLVSHGINYDGTIFTNLTEEEGMEQALHYWVPSIAPCGMDFITGDRYPAWKNRLLVGSLKYEYLHMCKLEGGKVVSEELLMKNIGRVRNVKQGLDGYIYVAVEEPGRVFRLIPAPA